MQSSKPMGWWVSVESRINQFKMSWKSWMLTLSIAAITTFMMTIFILSQKFFGLVNHHIDYWLDVYLYYFKSFGFLKNDPKLDYYFYSATEALFVDLWKALLIAVPIGLFVVYRFYHNAKRSTSEMSKPKYMRGTTFVPYAEQVERASQIESNFSIAGIPLSIKSETSHIQVVGTSGSGKTQLLKPVIQKFSTMDCKALVHDIKGDWISENYQPEKGHLIFNPIDKRSICWTVWNDIHDVMDIKNFAEWVVPDNPQAKDPFWQISARMILESILLYLWKNDLTTNEAIRKMIHYDEEKLYELLEGYPARDYARKKDSLLTMKSHMGWVDFLRDGNFSIRQWVNEPAGILFIGNIEKTRAMFKPVLTLFINCVASEVLTLSENLNRRIYFALDEFAQLQKLQKVIELMELSRSKGACIIIGFQNFQQLQKIYGAEDMKTIMNNSGSIVVMQLKEPDAAQYYSERFGSQEFLETSQTISMGVADFRDGVSLNEQRKEEFIIKGSDILNMQPLEAYIKLNHLKGVTKATIVITKMEEIAVPFQAMKLSKEEQILLVAPSAYDTLQDIGQDAATFEMDLEEKYEQKDCLI